MEINHPAATLRFIATGSYRYPMPSDLMNALRESIIQHMKAYGVTEIQVEGKHLLLECQTVHEPTPGTGTIGRTPEWRERAFWGKL